MSPPRERTAVFAAEQGGTFFGAAIENERTGDMNELAKWSDSLPESMPDLRKFVLIGREKMTAVRAEIRAIDKLGLAEEVRRQKLDEAQMISEAVLDAEVRIGTLTAGMAKVERMRTDLLPDSAVAQTKTQAIRQLGFSPKQAFGH